MPDGSYAYDDLGRRTALSRINATRTDYGYDAASRLTSLQDTLNNGTWNRTVTFSAYNPAGQIGSRTASNDLYAFTQSYNVNRSYTADGLNRYSAISTLGSTPIYDARGNLTQAGGTTYGYTALNELGQAGSIRFDHDALQRLVYSTGTNIWLERVGDRIISERDASGNLLRRYAYGTDEAPVVWYEGSGTGDRRFLDTDERGSVTAIADNAGNAIAVNSYDEYGIPSSGNLGRFGYTGQAWLPEVGLYDYKARTYSPTLGRFLQTDPIGYGDGLNWYNYVGGDPVNGVDPSGLSSGCSAPTTPNEIVVCAKTPVPAPDNSSGVSGVSANPISLFKAVAHVFKSIFCGIFGCYHHHSEAKSSTTSSSPLPQSGSSSSGPVISLGGSLEGYIGPFGGGAGAGGYYDTGTGNAGVYGTTESASPQQPMVNPQGFGYGGSINLISVGVARDMSSFSGPYQTVGAGFGPVSVTYSFSVGHLFSPISVSIGLGVNAGPPTPVQFHNSYGNTSVLPLFRLRW